MFPSTLMAQDSPSFSSHGMIGDGFDGYQEMVMGDLNRDGFLDIVALGDGWSTNQIFLNDGEGQFDIGNSFGYNAGAADLALGDVNGDGYLDIVTGGEYIYDDFFCLCYVPTENWIYLNDGLGNFPLSPELAYEYSNETPLAAIAIGDMNGDGHLDIVTERAPLDYSFCGCLPGDPYCACDTVAISTPNTIYINGGTGQFDNTMTASYASEGSWQSEIVIDDFNGDDYLDILARRNSGGFQLFINDGQSNFSVGPSIALESDSSSAFATGDLDGDGDTDLVTQSTPVDDALCGCRLGNHLVHLNGGDGTFAPPYIIGDATEWTPVMVIGDIDNDENASLDLIVITSKTDPVELLEERIISLYVNDGQGGFDTATVDLVDEDEIFDSYIAGLILGDVNNDGALDLLTSPNYYAESHTLYLNDAGTPNQNGIAIEIPHVTRDTRSLTTTIPVTYTIQAGKEDQFDPVRVSYSLDNGANWNPGISAVVSPTNGLTGGTFIYAWDTSNLGFYGLHKSALIRMVASRQSNNENLGIPGEFKYINVSSGPFLFGTPDSVSAISPPFHLLGAQIRVMDAKGSPVKDAFVYRLPPGQESGAQTLRRIVDGEEPTNAYRTDEEGYLKEWDLLAIHEESTLADGLVAMRTITATDFATFATDDTRVRPFEISAMPIDTGLKMVQADNAQEIIIPLEQDRVFALFDLVVSLEWDASLDRTFHRDLEVAFARASEVLFDVTNGQIALGNVDIYSNKQKWANADIVIYANSSLRPRATMGGIVNVGYSDIDIKDAKGNPQKDTYSPGQIRMGPVWDPFGQSDAELTQDWWRALAHELAHYLLFLPDNYLGIEELDSGNKVLRVTDCIGSFMTNAYDAANYSEFLTDSPNDWKGECTKTVAEALTGRADWETIQTFYPKLVPPDTTLAGPHILPLEVTRVRFLENQEPTAAESTEDVPTEQAIIPARFFDLRGIDGQRINLAQAQAYLFKTNGTPEITDDYVIALGSTGAGSDRIKVRGAETGDRLCILNSEQLYIGCDSNLSETDISIPIVKTENWQPRIDVSHVNSTTLAVTVTNELPANLTELTIQVLPSQSEEESEFKVFSPRITVPATNDTFSAQFTLTHPSFEGFVRVCGPCSEDFALEEGKAQEARESITQFYLSPAWGPEDRGLSGGANRRDWQANRRSFEAPIASGDGKVTILNVNDILADTGTSSLQSLSNLPSVPPWLTPIGPGYRFVASDRVTRTIAFQYLQREVSPGYEHTLNIYYLPEGAEQWQRLSTGPIESGVDIHDNLATAIMPDENSGQGIYALMATVEMPSLAQGWNIMAMPLPGVELITETLASIEQNFSIVYQYDPHAQEWQVFDRALYDLELALASSSASGLSSDSPSAFLATFGSEVNDLREMSFGQEYWIHATEIVTPHLPIPNTDGDQSVQAANVSTILGLPPAVILGGVEVDYSGALSPGTEVIAEIDGKICGRTQIMEKEGMFAYRVFVASRMEQEGCGVDDRSVTILINGEVVAETGWTNQAASVLDTQRLIGIPTNLGPEDEPVSEALEPVIFLPIMQN